MPGWTVADVHPPQGRTFQRPLSISEHALFREGLFNGVTDFSQYLELRLLNGARDAHVFSEENIARAWVSTKRRFPLVGAVVQRRGQGDTGSGSKVEDWIGDSITGTAWEPHFIVREYDLSVLRPGEIIFGQVVNAVEAERQMATILDGPRTLSDNLLVQLYVFRESNSEGVGSGTLHMMVLMAHCVADGIASRTLLRCLLDSLARGFRPGFEPTQMPLEDRLAMAIPMEEREPAHLRTLSLARRRWRRAVAAVILQLRFAKRQGGHTLPCRLTRLTPYTTACSGLVETSLTQAQSAAVIAKCRQHKVTFGNAYLVLAQVAMTRVLYRRFLRGDISEEEWAYRKRQPYINDGPVNLRPYLDKAWFEMGGGGEFMFSVNGYTYQLPFMTLGRTHGERDTKRSSSDGVPPFSDLLTFDRFLHRAGLIRKQAAAFFNHPLFFETMHALFRRMLEHQFFFEQQVKRAETGDRNGKLDGDEALTMMDIPTISAHDGSSLGNVDPIFPLEYPLPTTHPLSPYSSILHPSRVGYLTPSPSVPLVPETDVSPTIAVERERSHLRVRPGGIYLGAVTSRGQLRMYSFYDGNVFQESVVSEWLDEVKEAVLWYLA